MKSSVINLNIVRPILLITLSTAISACGGGSKSTSTTPKPNVAPTVNAGANKAVQELTSITLSGAASDTDGYISNLQWQQTAGVPVTLTNDNLVNATFDAPDVTTNEALTFMLTVTDNDGATAADSIDIIIGEPPTAFAGDTQFVNSGDLVTLDASSSTDRVTAILSYSWLQTDNLSVSIVLDDLNLEQPTFTVPEIATSTAISFEVTATDAEGLFDTATVLLALAPLITHKINDTNMLLCGNYSSISNLNSGSLNCEDLTDANGLIIPDGQDADYGRDKTSNDDTDGLSGFSYTKLDDDGNPLAQSSTRWNCVLDNVTRLVWEIKTNDGGLQDRDHSYSWYNPDSNINGGIAGTQNGGNCNGSDCDTNAYINAINANSLCGASDWRLPSIEELSSLLIYAGVSPSLDENYFNNIVSFNPVYWSSLTDAENQELAWFVNYSFGYDWHYVKSAKLYIRLVRTID